MARKIELGPLKEKAFRQMQQVSRLANQRLDRINRIYGQETWASKQLVAKLKSAKIDGLTTSGKIRISKNMKIGQMRQMTSIVEDFLHDKTSTLTGIKLQKKKIIEGMQQALSEEKVPLTDADAELLFQMLSDKETFRQFSDRYGASEVWSIMQEAKNKHVDNEEDFERLLGQIADYPDLETRASARKLYRKYLKKED